MRRGGQSVPDSQTRGNGQQPTRKQSWWGDWGAEQTEMREECVVGRDGSSRSLHLEVRRDGVLAGRRMWTGNPNMTCKACLVLAQRRGTSPGRNRGSNQESKRMRLLRGGHQDGKQDPSSTRAGQWPRVGGFILMPQLCAVLIITGLNRVCPKEVEF